MVQDKHCLVDDIFGNNIFADDVAAENCHDLIVELTIDLKILAVYLIGKQVTLNLIDFLDIFILNKVYNIGVDP